MSTAVVVVPFGLSAELAIGSIAITLAAWVVVAHWANPKAKRVISAALVVLALAALAPRPVQASEDPEVVISDPCKKYGPDNPIWWIAGCWLL